jgi:hypothetical protein
MGNETFYSKWNDACERASVSIIATSAKNEADVAIEAAKELLATAYRLKGIACSACDGRGEITYGETSSGETSSGETSSTVGICERCWGTGRADETGPDLRRIEELELEIDFWRARWKDERGGDPDGVTPDDLRVENKGLRQVQELPEPPEMGPDKIAQIAEEAREWREKFEQLTKDIEGLDPKDRQTRVQERDKE